MRLRLREKQSLYHHLGQLLRSGVTFPAALRHLAPSSRGSMRTLLDRLNRAVEAGSGVAEAFAAQRPGITELEVGVVAAVERAGRLEHGLAQLSEYFGALEQARGAIFKRLAYPIFLLHFGIFCAGATTLTARGIEAYLQQTGVALGVLYAALLVGWLAAVLVADAAATSAAADAVLRRVPLVGSIRRNFATSRFCATYEMQMAAGVNVMDALRAASRASRSGLVRATVARAIPKVVNGAKAGEALASGSAFPEEMLRGFAVGEQTGKLDEELLRLAQEHQRVALARLDTLSEWVPRLCYLAICLFIGWKIVSFYAGYMQQINDLTK